MRIVTLAGLVALTAGCLPPPAARTVDINRLPSRQAEQVLANHQDGKTPWVTITGRINLAEVLGRP